MLNSSPRSSREEAAGIPAGATLVAPLWHTLLLIAIVLTVSVLGLRTKAHTAALNTHHMREYLFTLGYEWALAAAVLWGIWLRRTPFRLLIGKWRQGLRALVNDAGVAIAFWAASALVLTLVGALLRLAHLKLPDKTVSALAPRDIGELLVFFALSCSAGFCEELLFRGYFQQQFARLARGRVWIGAAASAVLFGLAHLYEGAAGVISIAIFGAMFSLLALKRRSLRPGMMAHAWHDALSGLLLYLLQHSHLLST
jgi:membrane protease YdiL (CAAX protease family)